MPTPNVMVRLEPQLIDDTRRQLRLPEGTSVSHIVRAALERLTGNADSAGISARRVGRPPKTR